MREEDVKEIFNLFRKEIECGNWRVVISYVKKKPTITLLNFNFGNLDQLCKS